MSVSLRVEPRGSLRKASDCAKNVHNPGIHAGVPKPKRNKKLRVALATYIRVLTRTPSLTGEDSMEHPCPTAAVRADVSGVIARVFLNPKQSLPEVGA